jgi:hypothetical protein
MKFKDKLKSMNCQELFYKSLETSRRATAQAIVNLILCSCYWLLHGYLIKYLFLAATLIIIPILIAMMVRIKKTDQAFIKKDKEEFARLKQKVVAIGEVIEKAIEEEGGDQ